MYNDDHAALQYAVAFVPAAPFCANNADARTLRLSFVTPSVEKIHRVVAEKRLPNDLAKIVELFMPWREELARAVVEATPNWYWLVVANLILTTRANFGMTRASRVVTLLILNRLNQLQLVNMVNITNPLTKIAW